MPWRRAWQPTLVFLPGESHRQRSLVGYSPWGHTELNTAELLTLSLSQLSHGVRVCFCSSTCSPFFALISSWISVLNCLFVISSISVPYTLFRVIVVSEGLGTLFLRLPCQEGSDLNSTNERLLQAIWKLKGSCHLAEDQSIYPQNQQIFLSLLQNLYSTASLQLWN